MKKYNLLVIGLISLVISSCAQQTVVLDNSYNSHLRSEELQPFFIGGIAQNQNIPAAQICGGASNVAKVETIQSPIDILAMMFTFGIFTPRDAKVYCSGSGSYYGSYNGGSTYSGSKMPTSTMSSSPNGVYNKPKAPSRSYQGNNPSYSGGRPSYGSYGSYR